MEKKRNAWKIIIPIVLVILLALAVYFMFFFKYSCNDEACFKSHQSKCTRSVYVRETDELSFKYEILGKSKGMCEIEVSLIQVKQGTLDLLPLQGKSMICSLPIGDIGNPEEQLPSCHGELREELQETLILKLHKYIISNLGKIDEELESAF